MSVVVFVVGRLRKKIGIGQRMRDSEPKLVQAQTRAGKLRPDAEQDRRDSVLHSSRQGKSSKMAGAGENGVEILWVVRGQGQTAESLAGEPDEEMAQRRLA